MAGKPTRITVGQVENIAAKLRQMPPVEPAARAVTKLETIRMLTKEIGNLRQRGYTLVQIAELLSSEGLAISEHTLSVYLAKVAPSKRPKAKPTERKAQRDTPPPPLGQGKGTFEPKPDSEEI